MLYRFPVGFERRSDRAPGSIDEVQQLDGAAEVSELSDSRLPRGCGLVVRGWTFDPVAREPAAHVILSVDDEIVVEPSYGSPRPDIARAFEKASLEATGFKGIVSTGSLALGSHELKLYALRDDSTFSECHASFRFEVMPSAWQIPNLAPLPASDFAAEIEELSPTQPGEAGSPTVALPRTILVVRGFVVDQKREAPAKAVYVKIGEDCRRAVYGAPRQNLPDALAEPKAKFSGFTARFNTATIAPGTHGVSLIAVSSDGAGLAELGVCATLHVPAQAEASA